MSSCFSPSDRANYCMLRKRKGKRKVTASVYFHFLLLNQTFCLFTTSFSSFPKPSDFLTYFIYNVYHSILSTSSFASITCSCPPTPTTFFTSYFFLLLFINDLQLLFTSTHFFSVLFYCLPLCILLILLSFILLILLSFFSSHSPLLYSSHSPLLYSSHSPLFYSSHSPLF